MFDLCTDVLSVKELRYKVNSRAKIFYWNFCLNRSLLFQKIDKFLLKIKFYFYSFLFDCTVNFLGQTGIHWNCTGIVPELYGN